MNDFPRPRRPRTDAPLPTSSPFECWVDLPAALRRYDTMSGVQRAHALADWIEDVGAMNLATELLRTREVMTSLLRLLKQHGIALPEEHKRAEAQVPDQVPDQVPGRIPGQADVDRAAPGQPAAEESPSGPDYSVSAADDAPSESAPESESSSARA